VLNLDDIAKEEQENPLLQAELAREFGSDIVSPDGTVNRRLLAKRAFASDEAARRLGEICWPPVIERVSEYLVGGFCQPLEQGTFIVIEVPMLVEEPALIDLADEVLCVSAPQELRLQRAVARGMSADDVKARISQQATDDEREQICDTVFDNSGSLEALYAQLQGWYELHTMDRLF
jgi:dephospho-CoA kinase